MQCTNRTLYEYHNELERTKGSIVHHFFKSKIKEFYNNNGIRLNTLIAKMKAKQAEYFEIENDEVKFDTVEGKKVFKLLEGKAQEDFNKEIVELMNKPIQIIV